MSRRLWIYSAVVLIIVVELTFYAIEVIGSNKKIASLNSEALSTRQAELANYLKDQTDQRKLISLAKKLKNQDSSLIQLVADKAYELAPDSRDAVLLAYAFHPELKSKLLELDPLYQE